MSRMIEVRLKVRRALEEAGAIEITYSHAGSSHQRFDFLVGDVEGRFVFACTPGKHRAINNAVAMAKRRVREYQEGLRSHGQVVRQAKGSRGAKVQGPAWQ
jgi:hypothetical protein